MKLYFSPNSPYARKCRVVALEKKLNVEFVQVDPWASPAELLAVNPLSKIPALITDEGMALCESPVICEYLDMLSPQPKLLPAAERLQILGIVALADGIMDEAVTWVIETLKRPKQLQWPDYIQRKEEGVMRTINLIAPHVANDEGLNMGTIALAVALAYVSFRMPHLNWRDKHQKLADWLDNFEQRPSMQQTQPIG